jgi:uncharacterized protein
MKDKIIQVQGHGTADQTPDLVILSLTIATTDLSYAEANALVNSRVARLREDYAQAGFDPKELKTTQFGVQRETEYSEGRTVFKGFRVTHSLELRFPFEKTQLNRVMQTFSGSGAQPELAVEFSVADPEQARSALLESAVRNARSRAEVIARAAGARLGEIVRIEYGYTEVKLRSDRFGLADSSLESAAPDLTPADIRAEDTVVVFWEIA